jgi:hypothetical protein
MAPLPCVKIKTGMRQATHYLPHPSPQSLAKNSFTLLENVIDTLQLSSDLDNPFLITLLEIRVVNVVLCHVDNTL